MKKLNLHLWLNSFRVTGLAILFTILTFNGTCTDQLQDDHLIYSLAENELSHDIKSNDHLSQNSSNNHSSAKIDWDKASQHNNPSLFIEAPINGKKTPRKATQKKTTPQTKTANTTENSTHKPVIEKAWPIYTESEELFLHDFPQPLLNDTTDLTQTENNVGLQENKHIAAVPDNNVPSTQANNSSASTPAPVATNPQEPEERTILINFNNVNIIELIRFISKISNKNFYFNEEELDFNVTIVSEEPTTIENVLMALLQELQIHDFSMIEQGDNIIIHKNNVVKAPGAIRADSLPQTMTRDSEIITQVFRLNTANVANIAAMIQPILSQNSIVEVLEGTNHLIITDISSNIEKIALLIKSVDAPNSSLIIGQFVVRNALMETLVQNAQTIVESIAPGQPVTFIAHNPSNSIFIVSTPFLVERAIPILQRLDQLDGVTGIYNLDDLKFISPELQNRSGVPGEEMELGPDGKPRVSTSRGLYQGPTQKGRWRLDPQGNWYFEPDEAALKELQTSAGGAVNDSNPPDGYWRQDAQGNWEFIPGTSSPQGYTLQTGPKGLWEIGPDGKWRFMLGQGESIFAGKKVLSQYPSSELPLGNIERTKFLIHKLNYRLGESIEAAILRIGDSLRGSEAVNADLLNTISSVQWLEASNSLIFTGSTDALLKVKELVEEIDQPLRQVFIEMLIMDTSVNDSLDYSVNWGSRFDQGKAAGLQAFRSDASLVGGVLETAGLNTDTLGRLTDTATVINNQTGYNAGIIGRSICVGGLEFTTLAALVKAVHEKTDTNIVMNPKIITEDNVTAEIFVGLNTSFKTQSVANDQGSVITNNFEFRDVGTTLRVTPLLGPSNIITLQIEEEVSDVISQNASGGLSNENIGPTTRINRTTTQVHIPDKCFLVISGMIQDSVTRGRSHIPCLGAAPVIGAAFSSKTYRDEKRCLMIFIRPQLIDTEKQMDDLTKHQQNIYRIKRKTKKMWKLDTDEALDWMNLKETDTTNDDRGCCDFKY